ncbi:MAG: twin-arginine translocation pathway signal protein [Gammaproteobacteria bacterium CG11_big_fil_rev_8_21_14_0_20_46_22]|nr:MAG: twin-arginine translocation pathway signal protein [Gammaproteobacteria bacterium CG12_big_fil_rev_8_21_14_0_65_46_12]PIR11721.1 MAG: twin-arginine translocation pathway signal protein [Gammaproteobacteria bacterium CG11_big_fil_rev_8_21_14_0_20_46_22]
MWIDASIVIIFLAASLFIGIKSSKHIVDFDRFSVGHRAFSSAAIFATLSASFIGGGYTLGNAAKVYQAGMLYAFALLGFSLKEILVALIIAPRMDAYRDCLSIGDIIAKRYGNGAKVVTGLFSVLVCTGILGAQVGAMTAIFGTFFTINPLWATLVSFAIIIIYSSLGGMRAVVYTDILQFCVLVIGIPLTLIMGLIHFGGWQPIAQRVPHEYLYFWKGHDHLSLFIGLFITFIFGEALVPPYVQRLFMAKTARATRNGVLASGILSIPFFLIAGAIGLIAFALNPHINSNSALPYVVKMILPIGVKGFVIAGLVAIIMSSAAGFLNAASVAFVNDIVKPLSRSAWRPNTLLRLAKGSTLFVGIGALVFALSINNVLDILLYAYNFWAPIIIVPLVAVIFNFSVKAQDFFIGACCGIGAMLIWSLMLHSPFEINGLVIGVVGNLIGFMLSKPFQKQKNARGAC